jgi:hypothetical protein
MWGYIMKKKSKSEELSPRELARYAMTNAWKIKEKSNSECMDVQRFIYEEQLKKELKRS